MHIRCCLILLLALAGCASEPPAEDSPSPAVSTPQSQPAKSPTAPEGSAVTPKAEESNSKPAPPPTLDRVLTLEDERIVDAEDWPQLLEHDDATIRARAARALGRVRAPVLAAHVTGLERDADDAVEVERIFALGQIGADSSTAHLTARLADESAAVRAAAVQALAKLKKPHLTKAVLHLLEDPEPAVRGQAALALARLRGRRVKPAAPFEADEASRVLARLRRLLDDADPGVVWRAVYALANLDLPRRLPVLEQALLEDDEAARVFALRGIGRLEGEDDRRLETVAHALKRALRSGQPHAATTAAQVLARLGPNAIPYLTWASAERPEAESKLGPRSHHVRAAAMAALARLAEAQAEKGGLDDAGRRETLSALRAGLKAPGSVREAALVALAQVDPAGAVDPVREAASTRHASAAGEPDAPPEPARRSAVYDRLAAASACAHLADRDAKPILHGLLSDPDPRVVCAALGALSGHDGLKAAVREAALDALTGEDVAVRTTGLSLLAEHGRAGDVDAIAATIDAAPGDSNAELRVEGVKALGALGAQEDAKLLERLTQTTSSDPSPAVRHAAAKALAKVRGEDEVSPPPSPTGPQRPSSVELSGDAAGSNPRLVLHTTKGKLVLELFRRDAPRHVKSMVERTRAGKQTGLVFHRVVSAFVIQGLDPRGDGWGTDDVFLRDEINRRPYVRGSLGMPNAGRDTGGCQIFVNHLPTPHLDGNYTVFGQVVEGFEVLDAIAVGDVCERAEIVD